ncbi:MAG: FGGY-family carbohydrate kinase [Christensenellales bacterium]|jgi:sugar (pentulose or hexulose) kinase
MEKKYLLGYDIGTSGSKGVIIDLAGNILATSSTEHDVEIPRPAWAEQNADLLYWGEFQTNVKNLVAKAKINPAEIAGIGVSGLTPDAIAVDNSGKALRNCIIYMDRRATAECEWVENNIGKEELFKVAGNIADPYYAGYKCMWIRNNEPEIYNNTWKFVNSHAYIVLKLTGQAVVDAGVAGLFAPFFNIAERRWDEDMINRCGFDIDKLPKIYEATDIVGYVSPEAAELCGLAPGIPVIAGNGCDASSSGLSTGMIHPGESTCMCGTTHCWMVVLDKPVFDPGFINFPYLNGTWIALAGLGSSGGVVKWFRDNFGGAELEYQGKRGVSAYELLNLEAARVPKGSDGVILLPYFMGERSPIWDPKARGMFFGLSLYHTRAHMFRAILEGIAYALEHHAVLLRDKGMMPNRITVTDGGAASAIARQAFADVLRVPVDYASKVAGAPVADAFLAGLAVGLFKSVDEIKNWVNLDITNEPDPSVADMYQQMFNIYVNLYKNTKGEMHALANL